MLPTEITKNIYCPKCGGVVPGLDNDNFRRYNQVYMKCVESVKAYRSEHGTSLQQTPLGELYQPALDSYYELTGFRGADALHLWRKHRISKYPLYCDRCNLCYLAPTTGRCPVCSA